MFIYCFVFLISDLQITSVSNKSKKLTFVNILFNLVAIIEYKISNYIIIIKFFLN